MAKVAEWLVGIFMYGYFGLVGFILQAVSKALAQKEILEITVIVLFVAFFGLVLFLPELL